MKLDRKPVYANYIGPSVMTDANSEGFPICDERITENDRCVTKIIGIHWKQYLNVIYQVCVYRADRKNKIADVASYWLRLFLLLL